MSKPLKPGLEADGAIRPTGRPSPTRDRVLEVACEVFAGAGFHGTCVREICKRAGTNVAGVCYHFQSKEGLYQAVMMEAGRRLSEPDDGFVVSGELPPEQRLVKLVESLIQRLSARGAWIAKLLARELVDAAGGPHNFAASGLERDFVLLQALIREFLGAKANGEAIRFNALHVIGDCVAYCLARENPQHPLTQLAMDLPCRAHFARLVTQGLLGALAREDAEPEVSHP